MIKAILIAYLIATGFIVFVLYRNSTAPDTYSNLWTLFGALAFVAFSARSYFPPVTREDGIRFAIFHHLKSGRPTSGAWTSPYSRRLSNVYTNTTLLPSALEFGPEMNDLGFRKGIDLLEKGIVQSLLHRFSMHWLLNVSESRGPFSKETSYGRAEADVGSRAIELEEIRRAFSKNPLIATPGIVVGHAMAAPEGATISTSQSDLMPYERTIRIKNRSVEMRITLANSSSGRFPPPEWILGPGKIPPGDEFATYQYQITVRTTVNRWIATWEDRNRYQRWHDSVVQLLSEFDWNSIESQFLTETANRAHMKTLGYSSK